MTEIGGPGGPSRAGGGFWDFFKPKAESGKSRFGIDSARLSASARRFVQAMKTIAGKALDVLEPRWPDRNLDGPRIDDARKRAETLASFGQYVLGTGGLATGATHLQRNIDRRF